jgi:D-tyrosyl-tRNA(Tyr) deacylase
MKAVIQRVSQAQVTIEGNNSAAIGQGLVILLGISVDDTLADAEKLCRKIPHLRIFSDQNGQMNLSVLDINGEVMIISQFTLYGNASKGNRPSFIRAAKPEQAIPLYEYFIKSIREKIEKTVTGVFGADMKVALINDGPVTIILESKNYDHDLT